MENIEIILGSKSDYWFSCPCREWRAIKQDKDNITEQPEKTSVDHKCEKLTVFRDYKGFRRYYQRT